MAEPLYVLYETGSGEDDLEGLHEALVNEWLFNEYRDEFSYFTTEWDESNKEDSFFGKDAPEKMRGYANGWNDRLNQTLRYAEETVRKDMAEKGYKDFVNYISENRDGLPAYWFRKAMNESTGRFQYGHNYVAYTEYSRWTTVLSDKDVENINAHPENYAVILCFYH